MKNKRFTFEPERNPTLVAIRHYTQPIEDLIDTPEEIDDWFYSLDGADNIDEEYEATAEEQIWNMFEPFIETHEQQVIDFDF